MLGHDEVWRAWRMAMSGPRMHHAWMLAGKRGLGKMCFALAAARELVGGAEGRLHPDVIVLTHLPKDDKEEKKRDEGKSFERKRSIGIDQVREMQRRLTTRPTMGEKRAIIIDPVDDLERNASNALLKSLEEPPSGTYFLLVSHRPTRVLPTIRSRCRMLRFPAITETEIADWLEREAPDCDAAARDAANQAAAGSPGAALAFLERDLGEISALMRRLLSQGDPDFALRAKLVAAIGARPDRERMQAIFDLAQAALSEGIGDLPRAGAFARIEIHGELARLAGEAPTYNFDAGLLVVEIGTLLAGAAQASERAHG